MRTLGHLMLWIAIISMLGCIVLAFEASPTRDQYALAHAAICNNMRHIQPSPEPCPYVQTEWNFWLLGAALSGLVSNLAFLTIGLVARGVADLTDDMDELKRLIVNILEKSHSSPPNPARSPQSMPAAPPRASNPQEKWAPLRPWDDAEPAASKAPGQARPDAKGNGVPLGTWLRQEDFKPGQTNA